MKWREILFTYIKVKLSLLIFATSSRLKIRSNRGISYTNKRILQSKIWNMQFRQIKEIFRISFKSYLLKQIYNTRIKKLQMQKYVKILLNSFHFVHYRETTINKEFNFPRVSVRNIWNYPVGNIGLLSLCVCLFALS